jgi:glycerophosphoryl diester phosphodiesterase
LNNTLTYQEIFMNVREHLRLPSTRSAFAWSNSSILTVAHRGYWHQAPENSLEAIAAAAAIGVDIAEVDVQSTNDGALVLLHDETLDRTTDQAGKLSALPFGDVESLRLREGNGSSPKVTAARLPTLGAALELARGRILLNLDLKDQPRTYELVDRVSNVVLAAGMADQVILKCEMLGDADEFIRWVRSQRFHGRIAFMPILRTNGAELADEIEHLGVLGSRIYEVRFANWDALTRTGPVLHRQNARLWLNTLNPSHSMDYNDTRAISDPQAVWGRLAEFEGLGAIQTDHPQTLIKFLRTQGRS